MSQVESTVRKYNMPAEWEPHEAVWLQWPHVGMRGTASYARKLQSTWLEMTAIMADHVVVRIAAAGKTEAEDVQRG